MSETIYTKGIDINPSMARYKEWALYFTPTKLPNLHYKIVVGRISCQWSMLISDKAHLKKHMQLHHDYTSEEFNMEFPRPGFKSIPKIDKISNDEVLTEGYQ